jgi:acetyltransferase-like isoleucine patch superfamily enzyme
MVDDEVGPLTKSDVARRLSPWLRPRYGLALARWFALRITVRGGPCLLERGADLHIGRSASVSVGAYTHLMRDFTARWDGRVNIGSRVVISRGCQFQVSDSLEIGDDCLISERVSIHDTIHGYGKRLAGTRLPKRDLTTAPVRIGRDVWIGAKATILHGVTIGDDVVIGANSVVTRSIPPHCLAAGVPAVVVRRWDPSGAPTDSDSERGAEMAGGDETLGCDP